MSEGLRADRVFVWDPEDAQDSLQEMLVIEYLLVGPKLYLDFQLLG